MKKMKQTEFVAKQTCTIVADLLHAWGVEDVVLSPGSRNAPLNVRPLLSLLECRWHRNDP